MTSVALYFEQPSAPPRFIYVFENARIRAIVSPKYARHGAGHVRTKARITLFARNGDPEYQADVGSEVDPSASGASASTAGSASAVADASHAAPAFEIQEEEVPGACLSLWITYVAASAGLAAASTALPPAAATCVTGVLCPAAGAALLAWLYALDKWQIALDKLTDCIAYQKLLTETSTGGGGPDPTDGSSSSDSEDEWNDSTSTVEDFINDAIAGGNYSCSSDGTRCVYYAT